MRVDTNEVESLHTRILLVVFIQKNKVTADSNKSNPYSDSCLRDDCGLAKGRTLDLDHYSPRSNC